MDVSDRTCNECGGSDWREVEDLKTVYPDRRDRDRDKTERRVFVCNACDSEGRRFEDGSNGNVRFTNALR